MRNGWRKLLVVLGLALFGGAVRGARGEPAQAGPAPAVHLTIEVAWKVPERSEGANPVDPAGKVELEVSEGRVVDAVAWPSGAVIEEGSPPGRTRRLGPSDRPGRARARLEVPIGANVLVRSAGQTLRLPLAPLLEGPQRTPFRTPVEIVVERVAWDTLTVKPVAGPDGRTPGPGGDGVAAPGETVPLEVGLNVVTAEPAQVAVRCTAVLRPARGGDPVWRHEWQDVVTTNTPESRSYALDLPAPQSEGLYVLALETAWEPTAVPEEKGHLLGRLIRRGRKPTGGPGSAGTANRRVTLAVLEPREPSPRAGAARLKPEGEEVDTFDLGRMRANRPSAAGRSPMASAGRAAWPVPEGALVESTRRDRTLGWMTRVGPEVAQLGASDATGLAWSAVGLKVAHPGRPHRLTLAVAGGHAEALGVAVVSPAGDGTGRRPHLLLDACAAGPPVLPDAGPRPTFSWLVWPDSVDPVLVLVNRSSGGPVQVGTITLTELPDLPASPPSGDPADPAGRQMGLALTGPDVLERFGALWDVEAGLSDGLTSARNLGRYAAFCGARSVVLSEALSDRARRGSLGGQAAEDALGPDRLDLALRVLGRQGTSAWIELGPTGPLPGLPAPSAPEAAAQGLVRLDRQGQVDGPVPSYHALAPEVGQALKRRVVETIGKHQVAGSRLAGVLLRLGPGPTLPGAPDSGFDDATFARFVMEEFDQETARGLPGTAADDPERFKARARFLTGSGRMPWLTWRSRKVAALYAELAEATANAGPGLSLAIVTPSLGDNPAAAEARRADLAGLDPKLAWRAVGLDLEAWPVGRHPPIVLRGTCLSTDELAHDLATSPELDAEVASRAGCGLLLDLEDRGESLDPAPPPARTGPPLTALPVDNGPAGDEPLGHAIAALDAHWVFLSAPTAAGNEERLRRFARVFHALPATQGTAAHGPSPFGVSVRAYPSEGATYLALANDTPFPVRLDTILTVGADGGTIVFDDLGRGARLRPAVDAAGTHLVLDLLPFGVAAVRVGAPEVKVASVVPYPPEAVMTGLHARFDEVSERLSRLSRKPEGEHAGPPNPTFEPAAADPASTRAVAMSLDAQPSPGPEGWQVVGGTGTVSIDTSAPRSGRGSLRFDVSQPPASVASLPFEPGVHSSLLVQAWLRSDRPDAHLRLWIEGETGGQPYRRVSYLTAPTTWTQRAVRANDVPQAGIERVRLRFELLSAGSLWVDDLFVTGGVLSEPERRNARNTLLAAIQAYREKRYADFTRLADSHWGRVAIVPGRTIASSGPAGGGDASSDAADRAAAMRTGESSALPQQRRLR